MKLKDIRLGTRAVKRIKLPLVNVPSSLTPDVPELMAQRAIDANAAIEAGEQPTPSEVMVGVRVLTPGELATVYEKASEFARSKGAESRDTDPIYNLGVNVYLCAIACVDPDSDVRDPDPFFGERGDVESAALELFGSPHIGREGLQYLAQAQQLWQDTCSPSAMRMSPRDMVEAVRKAGGDQEEAFATFLALRPGMQWASWRFMASQLSILLTPKSSDTSTTSTTSSSGGPQSAPSGEAVS
jgi:hypothetical protein